MKFNKGGIVLTTSVIFIGFLLAGLYLALAIWLFPHIDRYTPKLEKLLSDTMNAKVTIKRTTARWQGITPYFSFDEVTISGKTKLSFARIDAGLALWRLPKVRFAHLALKGSNLSLWRDKEKHWYLAGASLDEGGDSPFMRWLLQQGKISFHKTTLSFEDRANQFPSFVLKTDDFFWKKKYRGIAFAGHFGADPAFATKIGVQGLWKQQATLAGAIKLSLIGLDAARLENPWFKGGKGDIDLDLQGERKKFLFQFSGHMHDMHLKLNHKPPLHIAQLSGNLLWKKDNKDQKVVLNHFTFAVPDQAVKPVSGQILWNDEHGKLAIDHLDISAVNAIATSLPLENNALGQRFTANGNLEKIDVSWQGAIANPLRYQFSLTAVDFSLAERNGDFGVTHLFGHAHGNEKGGSLDIASASTINLAQTFAKPLRFQELAGAFLWGINHEDFNLSLENIHLRNEDLHGELELHYYHRPGENELVLDLDLKEVVLANVVHYFPRNSSQNLKKWLAQSLIGGKAKRLTLHLGGDLDRFPFIGEKPPGFSLRAQLADATLAYSPAWPMLTGIDGTLTIENEKLNIQAYQAQMGHLRWQDLEATIANYVSPQKTLVVKSKSQGDGHAFMQTLFSTPLRKKLTALEDLKVSGPGTLKLALDIDLDHPDATKSQGEYRFEQTAIAYGQAASLQQASGALLFNDNRFFTAQPIEGFMFGGKTTCALKTLEAGDIQLDCQGRALAENLKQAVWPNLPASGQTAWAGTLIAGQDKAFLHIESNLQGLRLNLPPPIRKDDAEKSAFNLDLDFRQQTTQWRLRYAKKDVIDGEWWTDPKAPGYKITHGIFRINDHTPPPSSGLWITGKLDRFTIDDWLAYFAGDSQTSGFSPNRIRLDAKELEIFNRVFAQTALEATIADGGLWRIHAHGNDLLGELTFSKHALQAHFSRLNIGAKQPLLQSAADPGHAPTSIPNLDIHIQELIFEEKHIGAFDLVAKPKKEDIVIEQLSIAVPEGTFNGQGLWKNWRSSPSTDWKIELKTSNLGNLLQRYGLDGQVVDGEGSITGQLRFPEPPYAIDFTEAQGDVHFEFRKGRLIRLDTGIFGRLLGLVRLEALPRRLMLDFSDLFEKGFTFDLLKGESQLGNQKVTIQDMIIAGPPGGFFVSGDVDLAQERQALIVRFVPVTFVGDGLAIGAGILGGPAAGLGAFILQKALGDPLGKMLTLEYQVSGSWSDPKVQPLAKANEPKNGG